MIPVGVVDDHNEALDHYYKLIARNKIPFEHLALLHFDSHPDLAAPEELLVNKFKNRQELLSSITISDWILPAVHTGHFDTVIWIKPSWAQQIAEGEFTIEIGEDESGLLKTTSQLPYYTSDLCYRSQLKNSRKFQLHVFELSSDETQNSRNLKVFEAVSGILANKAFCLDIDMDFYSTTNPFMGLLGDHFQFIDDVFRFQEKGSLTETIIYRQDQLNSLKELCHVACSEPITAQDTGHVTFLSEFSRKYPDLQERIKEVAALVKDDEYITDLYYIGQQTELPHHISTVDEINSLIRATETLLRRVKAHPVAITTQDTGHVACSQPITAPDTGHVTALSQSQHPVAITLARSEYDEYSCRETLDHVHTELVHMIRELYPISDKVKYPGS